MRTPVQRLAALVFEYRELTKTGRDVWRRRCEIVAAIKAGDLWRGDGEPDFDGWALRVLGLRSPQVSKMLGIAYGSVGGERRRGPGRQGGANTALDGGARGRAREGQEDEVEMHSIASQPRSPSIQSGGPTRPFLEWASRQAERLAAHTPDGLMADRLSPEERADGLRRLDALIGFLERCRAVLGAPAVPATGREETPR